MTPAAVQDTLESMRRTLDAIEAALGFFTWAFVVLGAMVLLIVLVVALTWTVLRDRDELRPIVEAQRIVHYDAADAVWTSAGAGAWYGLMPDGRMVITNRQEWVPDGDGELVIDPSLPSPHETVAEWGATK